MEQPLRQRRDRFELGVLRSDREAHRRVEPVGPVRRHEIGALHAVDRASKVAHVEQVANDHLRAERPKLFDGVAEPASFDRSTRGRGLGEEEHHQDE